MMTRYNTNEFDSAQLERIDEVYEKTEELCSLLISSLPQRGVEYEQELRRSVCMNIADVVADILCDAGYTVFFPVHVECPDGTEYVSDIYNEQKEIFYDER